MRVSPSECRHEPDGEPPKCAIHRSNCSNVEVSKGSIYPLAIAWSWLFAPYILWKIRNIHDVHHWRLQITICLIAKYAPKESRHQTPKQWSSNIKLTVSQPTRLTYVVCGPILFDSDVGGYQQILGPSPLVSKAQL